MSRAGIHVCRARSCRGSTRGAGVHRRGFAAATAVALIGLVAAALTVIVTGVVADGRRTRHAAADAQVRQLLLAAATDAAEKARHWKADGAAEEWELPVPEALSKQGVTLKLSAAAPAEAGREVRVEANYLDRRAVQTLRFSRAGDAWELAETMPPDVTWHGLPARVFGRKTRAGSPCHSGTARPLKPLLNGN